MNLKKRFFALSWLITEIKKTNFEVLEEKSEENDLNLREWK